MRVVAVVAMLVLTACTGRALGVDAPVVSDPATADQSVPSDLASFDLASHDLATGDMLLSLCSTVCARWDHCSASGSDYVCNVLCDEQQPGYDCVRECDPTEDCTTFLACVATCHF